MLFYMPTLNDSQLQALLQDDAPYGDLTTHSLGIDAQAAHIAFHARQAMTVCGTEEACRLFELAGASATPVTPSGTSVQAGDLLLRACGTATNLHRGWKIAQTLLEWASGLSTATASVVTPEAVAACRLALAGNGLAAGALIAAAGGIRADNAAAYVRAGAEFLVTSSPYLAPPKDVQIVFKAEA